MTAVENRKDYEIGRVNVTDRDDRGTGNWEAKYLISNDPGGNFAIATDPATNQGVLFVVKVQSAGGVCERALVIIVRYPSRVECAVSRVALTKTNDSFMICRRSRE